MMSTSSHSKAENGVIQSSIGLLQERFRQLQRMKEMRENKELLRMFSDYNNNNTRNTNTNTNNTTTTTTTNVSPIIVSNTSYTTSTITSTTTTISGSTPISNNNNMNTNDNKNNISDSSMQYNDQLQIFIPPNYSSLNNPKSSCYSSSSSSAASSSIQAPPSSSSSSSRNSNMINPSDVSLSLWSYSNSTPAATTYPFRRENSDNLLSTMNMQQPVAGVAVTRASTTCVSTFYNKLEDPRHVTDVDTTLHL